VTLVTANAAHMIRVPGLRVEDWSQSSETAAAAASRRLAASRQIVRADDVVALKHAPGLVPRHLHRHTLGNAGADEIADGGPAEVVQDSPRAAGFRARRANATRKLLIGRPERWKTRGQTACVCRGRFSVSTRCCSSISRSSRVMGNVRPSPFFVVPGSSRTSPASKSGRARRIRRGRSAPSGAECAASATVSRPGWRA